MSCFQPFEEDEEELPTVEERKLCFLGLFEDKLMEACYHDRRGCEYLTVQHVEELLNNGHVTIKEMVAAFEKACKGRLKQNFPYIREE